jgi:hypothetical protein
MVIKKKVEIPAKLEERIVDVVCDLCGRKGGKYSCHSVEWEGGYQKSETEIRWSWGDCFPEGSGGEEYNIQICPSCFEIKLLPWLKEQGAQVKEEEWGY